MISTYLVNNLIIDVLSTMDDNHSKVVNNTEYYKYILYSGHDTQIRALIVFFELYNNKCFEDIMHLSDIEEIK